MNLATTVLSNLHAVTNKSVFNDEAGHVNGVKCSRMNRNSAYGIMLVALMALSTVVTPNSAQLYDFLNSRMITNACCRHCSDLLRYRKWIVEVMACTFSRSLGNRKYVIVHRTAILISVTVQEQTGVFRKQKD